jgi:hypothetical protein
VSCDASADERCSATPQPRLRHGGSEALLDVIWPIACLCKRGGDVRVPSSVGLSSSSVNPTAHHRSRGAAVAFIARELIEMTPPLATRDDACRSPQASAFAARELMRPHPIGKRASTQSGDAWVSPTHRLGSVRSYGSSSSRRRAGCASAVAVAVGGCDLADGRCSLGCVAR